MTLDAGQLAAIIGAIHDMGFMIGGFIMALIVAMTWKG